MTREQLDELTYEELLGWFEYFRRRPLGWREDFRAYVIMSAFAGSKVKPEEIFESIRMLKKEEAEDIHTQGRDWEKILFENLKSSGKFKGTLNPEEINKQK